jgi:hypothetical protein
LPNDRSSRGFFKIPLRLKNCCQWLPLLVFHYNKESMVIFKQLINFGYSRMINFFKFSNLVFEQLSFMTSYFIFINDVDGTHQASLNMYDFSQFIKLILLKARWKNFIFLFDTAFNLSNEINLSELNFVLSVENISCTLLFGALLGFIAHLFD